MVPVVGFAAKQTTAVYTIVSSYLCENAIKN